MNFSCLSPAEVRERFRRADNKRQIIQVLAELTGSSEAEMLDFLGIERPKSTAKPPRKLDSKKAMELYREGLNDSEIARRLDVSDNSVHLWRRRNGLASHCVRVAENEETRRRSLWGQGLSDAEIGEAVGVHRKAISAWRHVRGLPPNRKNRGGT